MLIRRQNLGPKMGPVFATISAGFAIWFAVTSTDRRAGHHVAPCYQIEFLATINIDYICKCLSAYSDTESNAVAGTAVHRLSCLRHRDGPRFMQGYAKEGRPPIHVTASWRPSGDMDHNLVFCLFVLSCRVMKTAHRIVQFF